ncbi:LOW QUALITY PROTEIN: breast cancer type 2 susceptibility protein homolog [Gigantopelta aegis]|uniref:LOW QUALITY PROTEIN: breast cancer type 2 susceptibility protein homolog n=1 Tax=Gigantopelta aegis TaxID=1735272 RepID=UPI001B88D275|nr:LOW QUALITY PROTEIN: breast cancer type 2 susceptibility protein homolog [Gigantopelta aegis]
MDRDCPHCGCHHKDVKFKSKLRRKRCLVNKNLQNQIGPSSTKWFDNLTEQSIQRCSTSQGKASCAPAAIVENSPLSTHHSLQAMTPGGGNLTPLSTWAVFATQDASTPRFSHPLVGVSPAFVSTPKMDTSVNVCTDISKELGVDDSVISWTSSMATPCLKNDMTVDLHDDCEENPDDKIETITRIKGFPRVLFTPDRTGLDSEDFARILEESRDNDMLDSSPCTDTNPSKTRTEVSPVINKRVKKRLSLGSKLVSGTGETTLDMKSGSQVSDVQNGGMLSPSSTNSVIVSVLSPFFDSPASEKHRAAPKGVKRKASELISIDDEQRMSFNSGSSPSFSQTGPQSILSSATKHTVSERKRVRFAADVEKSEKNSRSLRKRKSFSSKDVSCVEMATDNQNMECSDYCPLDYSASSDLALKIVNLNINNSCVYSKRTSEKSLIDILCNEELVDSSSVCTDDSSNRISLEEKEAKLSTDTVDGLKGPDRCSQVGLLSTDNEQKRENPSEVVVQAQLSSAPVGDCSHTDQNKLTSADETSVTGDELFSQVSESVWNEMCQSSNKETTKLDREVLDTDFLTLESSETVLETKPKDSSECKSNIPETKMHQDLKSSNDPPKKAKSKDTSLRLSRTRKFLYPSGSQISHVCPESIFNFHNMKPERNKKPDDVSSATDVTDRKQHEKENIPVEKETDKNNVLCEDGFSLQPSVSPRNHGSSNKIQLKKNMEHDIPVAKAVPRRRNYIEFKKFSEMFAPDMTEMDMHLREINEPLISSVSRVTPKSKSSSNCELDSYSTLKGNVKDDHLNSDVLVECKAQTVETVRPSSGFLSADELCGSEEPEEKNDYDFDMNTQEVENFVKDAFLDDMEFSQIAPIDKNGTVNDDKETTCDNSVVDNQLINKSGLIEDGETPDKCSQNVDNGLNETTSRLTLSSSADIQSKVASSETSKCFYNAVDGEVAFRCVGSSTVCKSESHPIVVNKTCSIDDTVSQRVQFPTADDPCGVRDNIPDLVKNELEHLKFRGFNEVSSFSTAHGKTVKLNQSGLQKAQTFLECEQNKFGSLKCLDPNEGSLPSFSTASGKAVTLNQSAVQKARTLFECEENKFATMKDLDPKEGSLPSFSTASGKAVTLNQSALQKARTLLECEQNELASLKSFDLHENSCPSFSTADSKAMKFNQNDLQEAECEQNELKSLKCSDVHEKSFPSFSTASSKAMEINQSVLLKAQTLLESEQNGLGSLKGLDAIEDSFPSFSTASGKAMKCNQNALQKAKTLLADDVKILNQTDCSSPAFSSVSHTHLKENKGLVNKTEGINRTSENDHSGNSTTSEGHVGSESGGEINMVVKSKNVLHVRETDMSDKEITDRLDTRDSKSVDNFEEIHHSILVDKNKCTAAKHTSTILSKETGPENKCDFKTCFGKENIRTTSFKSANPMLKPKGFRPFKKPKRISVQKPREVDSSKKTTDNNNHDRMAIEYGQDIKQLQTKIPDPQYEENVNSDVSESEMSEMMLKEFSHDIFSQCPSQGFCSQNTNPTAVEDTSCQSEKSLLVKDYMVGSPTNCSLTEESPGSPSRHSNSEVFFGSKSVIQMLDINEKDGEYGATKKSNCNQASKVQITMTSNDFNEKYKGNKSDKIHKNILHEDKIKTREQQISEPECFLGQGFQLASGKKVHISEQSLLEAKNVLADMNYGPNLEATLPETEISDLEMNEFVDNQISALTKDNYSDLRSEDVLSKQDTKDETNTFQHLHHLLTDDTLFEDDINDDLGKAIAVSNSKESLKQAKSLWKDENGVSTSNVVQNATTGFFQTASGKHVTISEESLTHAKSLWKDESSNNEMPNFRPGFFQTASGKHVTISEESLTHAKSLWKDESSNNEMPNSRPGHFQTASGKDVSVSKASIDHAKSLWGDESTGLQVPTGQDISNAPTGCFQTASGKAVSVSKESLNQAKSLWKDESSVSADSVIPNNNSTTGLFQTASGKDVTISEESLKHVKCLWKDESSNNDMPNSQTGFSHTASDVTVSKASLDHAQSLWKDKSKQQGHGISNAPTGLFQTASGKAVTVSKESITHAKSLWKDEFNTPTGNDIPTLTAGLFQTASGKDVTISEESITHAKSLWKDESVNNELLDSQTGLFQTTSNKVATLSKSSLNHEKATWKDESQIHTGQDISNAPAGLFQTASGKAVGVSKASLDHAKSLWRDEFSVPTGNDISGLFQTASGKNVTISEESLNHAKTLWKDDSSNIDIPVLSSKAALFQTASGKDFTISEESLNRAKSLWKDESKASAGQDVCNAPTGLFQTASGKDLTVFRSSLDRAKSLWKDEFSVPTDNPMISLQTGVLLSAPIKNATVSKAPVSRAEPVWKKNTSSVLDFNRPADGSCMFQTALGKTVSVSETALHKAKGLWEENDSINSGSEVVKHHVCFKQLLENLLRYLTKHAHAQKVLNDEHTLLPGIDSMCSVEFQTASGTCVDVVHESLSHVSDLSEESRLDSVSLVSERKKNDNAFQTASGNAVIISDSALKQTKKMFKDFENNPLEDSSLLHIPSGNRKNIKEETQHIETMSRLNEGKEPASIDISKLEIVSSNNETTRTCLKWDENENVQEKKGDSSYSGRCSENQRVTRRKVLKSTPEAYHTDRWSVTGKQFEPLYSDSLSERCSEYSLENIVGRPDPGSASSSFKTPYKKSPFVPMAQKPTDTSEVKKTKAPVFCPKSAIKHVQTNSRVVGSSPVSLGKTTPVTDTSTTLTEKRPSRELYSLVEARKKQEEIIMSKKKQKVRPSCGRMTVMKSSCSRYKYSDLTLQTGLSVQELLNMGILSSTINISSKTAQDYRFNVRQFYPNLESHILVGDGAFLVADDDGFAGTEEFYKAFLTIEGVDSSFVTDIWVTNHYKWIVWKLAAYEVAFPQQFGGRSISPDSVMLQLKYRYDTEIDNCHRSCLKKIIEKDDTACKRLILCVCGIVTITIESNGTKEDDHSQEVFLELTDGWYSVKGKLDGALLEMVERKQIVVGQKLCISGAELGGSEEACSPLEAPSSLFLKLSMNSTRPASWDSRLGYQRDPRPLCVAACSLHPSGGIAGCIDSVVLRIYPVMYMEKVENSTPIFRTAEAEERIQRQFDQSKEEKMEKLYEKIQAQFEREETQEHRRGRKKLGKRDLEGLQSGCEIWEAMESSLHPEELHSWLSVEQQQLMEEFQRTRHEQRQQQLQADFHKAWEEAHGDETTRKVTPVQKIRIAGCARRDIDSKITTIVTIWRPTSDWMDIREGKRYKFFGLVASSPKTRLVSHSVHLTASRQSCIKELPIDENYLDLVYEPREVWKVRDLRCRTPPNKEFDFVGITVDISSNSDKKVDTVYVADIDGDLMGIRFWGGVQSFGMSDLHEGKMFVVKNLVLKWSRGLGIVSVDACIEVSHFSHTGSSQEERKQLDKLKSVIQAEKEQFLKRAKTKLNHLHGLQHIFTPERRNPVLESARRQSATPCVQENIDMDFLDNLPPECIQRLFSPMDEGGDTQHESHSTSPKNDLVKKQKSVIRSKVAKLLAYGSPKPLSSLNSAISPAALNKFKPPLSHVKNLSSVLK